MTSSLISVGAAVAVFGIMVTYSAATIITSPELTNWGTWAPDFERCPEGRAAQGFRLMVETWGEIGDIDDTSMNGIRLYCGNPADGATPSITSNIGHTGKWRTNSFRCANQGYITGFELKVEKPGLLQDETATNSIRVWCTKNEGEPIEGDGERWGDWTGAVHCPAGEVVCGIKTQIQPNQFLGTFLLQKYLYYL